jgi:Mce-associated membrane protein
VSDSNGPVRRRRIAGEAKPAAPAGKPVPKVPARKAAAKKAATPTAPAAPAAPRPAPKIASKKAVNLAKPAPAPAAARPESAPREKRARPDGTGLRRHVRAIIGSTLVLVLGIALLVAGLSHARGSGDDGLDASRQQATSAAGTAAETIFSFRYDQLDQHLSASKAVMTPKFAKEFDKIAPALTDLAPQRKIVVKAVTREAAPLACGDECSETKVNVLVFVDQARLVGSSKQPTVFANRVAVSMVDGADGWRVDNIRAL